MGRLVGLQPSMDTGAAGAPCQEGSDPLAPKLAKDGVLTGDGWGRRGLQPLDPDFSGVVCKTVASLAGQSV